LEIGDGLSNFDDEKKKKLRVASSESDKFEKEED